MPKLITQDELKELLHYNPDTGVFTWLVDRGRYRIKGKIAGYKTKEGYWCIEINQKGYKAARLAWLYIYGKFPDKFADHINIRDVSVAVNTQNQTKAKSTSKSKILGVGKTKGGKFYAKIFIDSKEKWLGTFLTINEAEEAYIKAKRKYHEGCTI